MCVCVCVCAGGGGGSGGHCGVCWCTQQAAATRYSPALLSSLLRLISSYQVPPLSNGVGDLLLEIWLAVF